MILAFTLLWKRRSIARSCGRGRGGNSNYSALVEMNDIDNNDFEMPEVDSFRSSASAIRFDIPGEPLGSSSPDTGRGAAASYEDEMPGAYVLGPSV